MSLSSIIGARCIHLALSKNNGDLWIFLKCTPYHYSSCCYYHSDDKTLVSGAPRAMINLFKEESKWKR
jgi:hypothetical protein